MRRAGVCVFLILTGRPFGQPPGNQYYVAPDGDDRNPGTAERPWRRLRWAMSRPFLRGGDTIRVRGGIYRPADEPERGVADDTLIRPVASGEPGRPITVMAEPGEAVLISGRIPALFWEPAGDNPPVYRHVYPAPGGYPWEHPFQVVEDGRLVYRVRRLESLDRPGSCYVDTAARTIWLRTTDDRPPGEHRIEYGVSVSAIEFRGVSHWRLTGLAIAGFRATGVMIAGGAGAIEADHMDISFIGAHRPGADPTSGHAVAVYDSNGGNRIHDNRLHHTLAEAIHVSQTAAPGDRYENNEIHHSGGAEWLTEGQDPRRPFGPGMILRASGTAVARNRIYANGYHGLIVESDLLGGEGPASPGGNMIEGNLFAWNGANGLYGDGKNGLAASEGNLIRRNVFDRNNQVRSGSDADAELRLAGNFDRTEVSYNTIYSAHANGVLVASARLASGLAQGADAAPEQVRIAGNIVVHAAPWRRTWALRGVEPPGDLVLDGNDWYRASTGNLVEWAGVEYASLDDFRRRTGLEERGISADPRFVSAETGHFWLRAVSPAIGWGAFAYRPLLEAIPGELRFVAVAKGRSPAAEVLTVASPSGAAIAWAASAGEPWLVVREAGLGRLAVSVDPSGLPQGQYTGSIRVTPALEGEPALFVPVSLTVAPAPARRR